MDYSTNAFDNVASFMTSLTHRGLGAALVLFLFTTSAAAQEFCNTQGGQFAGAVQGGIGGIALAFLVGMLLLSALLKAVPIKGTNKLGNMAIGGFFIALGAIVLGLAFADFALGFSPIEQSMSCGNILGN